MRLKITKVNKILQLKLFKFQDIQIIYTTQKNQYWGIFSNGVKKNIGKEVFNIFLKKKVLISYKNSKLVKKGVRFNISQKSIEVVSKGISLTIEVLNEKKISFTKSSQISKELDQYYTKPSAVNLCILWYRQMVSIDEHLDLIMEPSAGKGSFIDKINSFSKNKIFLDLDPKHFGIFKKDFLKFEIKSNNFEKVHIIGNPPFKRVTEFILKASKLGDFIGFILPLSFKKDSIKKKVPLNFHCIFSKKLPKNSFEFESKTVSIPTVFQIWKKESYNREVPKKLDSKNFVFVKKNENPCLSFQRVGSKSGKISTNTDKTVSSHYFLKLKKGICLNAFLEQYKNINFLHDNTVGQKSISQQELIFETNKFTLK